MLEYKAENAVKRGWKVNPQNTSQNCSTCGELVKKSLNVRIHKCPHCEMILDRDHNAALNIKGRADLSGMSQVTVASEPRISYYNASGV